MLFLFIINCQTIHSVSFLGSGTEQDPYQLSTLAHLEELSDSLIWGGKILTNKYYNKHYILMNDITDTLRVCLGHGDGGPKGTSFAGVFDGQGYSITLGLDSCPPHDHTRVALFPILQGNFVIKNLTVNGYVNGALAAGIVASVGVNSFSSVITNGRIINCANNSKIISAVSAGGIAGEIAGAIVTIENCINLSEVQNNNYLAEMKAAGGIVGNIATSFNQKEITILNCINYGFVKSDNLAGGILGGCYEYFYKYNLILENNFNSGVVIGGSKTGCITSCIPTGKFIITVINNHYDKQMCGEED